MQAFSSVPMVAFGDVNLNLKINPEELLLIQREGIVKVNGGGWPFIKYYNKETGTTGGFFVQKTCEKYHEEYMDLKNMQNEIEEIAGMSLGYEMGAYIEPTAPAETEKDAEAPLDASAGN